MSDIYDPVVDRLAHQKNRIRVKAQIRRMARAICAAPNDKLEVVMPAFLAMMREQGYDVDGITDMMDELCERLRS